MMMKALEAGGLDAEYKQSRDEMKDRFADTQYDPNIGGLYELERQDYKADDFPRQYDGKLIKALNMGVPNMAVMKDGIRVVFMRRDAEEIRQSYDAFFGKQLRHIDNLEPRMSNIIEQILNRKDVISFDEFWYRDVVNFPLTHFEMLAEHGWPIDPQKCAAVVDPQYCRFRLEELEVGVL